LGQLWNTNTILLDLYVYAITQDAVKSVKKEDFESHMVGKTTTQDAVRSVKKEDFVSHMVGNIGKKL
jgi:hypothetical protein